MANFDFFSKISSVYMTDKSKVVVLNGNVGDIFPIGDGEYCPIRKFLATKLQKSFEIVLFFDKTNLVFGDEISGLEKDDGRSMEKLWDSLTANPSSPPSSASGEDDLFSLAKKAGNKSSPEGKDKILSFLTKAEKVAEKASLCVVIDYADAVVPEGDYTSPVSVMLSSWAGLESNLLGTDALVIAIDRTGRCGVNGDSAKINISRPESEDLASFLEARIAPDQIEDGVDVQTLANMATGLRLRDLDDVVLNATATESPISADALWTAKKDIIRRQSGGILNVSRPKHTLDDVLGIEGRRDVIDRQIAKLRAGDQTADKGWLYSGPFGTGKSFEAEALASEAGITFVTLGLVMNKYVGESERQMQAALDIVKAMSPTLLFIDEAAEMFGGGGGENDGGARSAVRGMLQNFLGDESLRGKVFTIFATNYPDQLKALKRAGRVDKSIPVLPPKTAEDRANFLSRLLAKKFVVEDGINLSSVSENTELWTQAELNELCRRAREFCEMRGGEKISGADLQEALDDYIPTGDEQEKKYLISLALSKANSRRLVPQGYWPDFRASTSRVGKLEKKMAKIKSRRREVRASLGGSA